MYRDIDTIPVLAPEGAIIPMYENDRTNDLSVEQPLELHIWRGNGEFELYDDDGETKAYRDGAYTITKIKVEEQDNVLRVSVIPPETNNGVLPAEREMRIVFRDVCHEDIVVKIANAPITVDIVDPVLRKNEDADELKNILLTRVQGSNDAKSIRFRKRYPKFVADALAEYESLHREGDESK
jgi:hypothetical protein